MNRKFWTLPLDQRKSLLEEKMTKKEYLSGFSCLGHLDRNQSLIISTNSDWVCTFSHETHPEKAILHEAFPYDANSPIHNEDVAKRLLTKYCYEKGVDPKSISFVLGNQDITSIARGRKFGFLPKKQKFIMRHVYVYIMPGFHLQDTVPYKVQCFYKKEKGTRNTCPSSNMETNHWDFRRFLGCGVREIVAPIPKISGFMNGRLLRRRGGCATFICTNIILMFNDLFFIFTKA